MPHKQKFFLDQYRSLCKLDGGFPGLLFRRQTPHRLRKPSPKSTLAESGPADERGGADFRSRAGHEDYEKQFNKLGADGWEYAEGCHGTGSTYDTDLLFKRPKR
jgi:hypothetical protein